MRLKSLLEAELFFPGDYVVTGLAAAIVFGASPVTAGVAALLVLLITVEVSRGESKHGLKNALFHHGIALVFWIIPVIASGIALGQAILYVGNFF